MRCLSFTSSVLQFCCFAPLPALCAVLAGVCHAFRYRRRTGVCRMILKSKCSVTSGYIISPNTLLLSRRRHLPFLTRHTCVTFLAMCRPLPLQCLRIVPVLIWLFSGLKNYCSMNIALLSRIAMEMLYLHHHLI